MSKLRDPALDPDVIAKHLDDLTETRRVLRNKWQRERHAARMESDPEYAARKRAREREYERKSSTRRARRLKYHAKDTAARLLRGARARAKQLGLPFDLTIGYLRQLWPADGRCPVFGFRMILDRDLDETPSLDRIEPALGYVQGNVRIISFRANRLKSDGDAFEFRRILEYLEAPDPLTHSFRWEDHR